MPNNRNQPLHIAQIAPLWARVPPLEYGGTELRVFWLVEELRKRGHMVTLYASGDSRMSAQLHPVYPQTMLEAMQANRAINYAHYANASFAEALRASASFDLLHCHSELEHISFGILSPVPVIYSLRTALSIDDHWLLQRYPEIAFVAMSHSQIKAVPAERRLTIPVIYNGCDFEQYKPSFLPGKYLAFLGRMGKHKNPLGAIRTARAVDLPIVLAGKPQDQAEGVYFEREIKPLINGQDVMYVGPVNQEQKRAFLSSAAALLFPIQWEEPFGIVMIEAMASGTPVVACNRGSAPEVIDPGITGYYADSDEEMAALVPKALELDRRRVREHAQSRFSHLRMVDEYTQLYRSVLGLSDDGD